MQAKTHGREARWNLGEEAGLHFAAARNAASRTHTDAGIEPRAASMMAACSGVTVIEIRPVPFRAMGRGSVRVLGMVTRGYA